MKRRRLAAAAILTVALALRVGYVLHTPGYHPQHDDQRYDYLAVGVAHTGAYPDVNGHPTAYRPPGFTYLLGGVYAVAGTGRHRVTAGRLAQAALGTGLVGLIGIEALLLLGEAAALAAMAIAAVYLPLVTAGTSLLSEPLAAALVVGAVVAVLAWRRQPRWRWAVLAGVLAGLLALTRSNGIIALPALAIGVYASARATSPAGDGPRARRRWWRASAPSVLLVAVAAAVIAPWTLRNAVVMHAFIPVSDEAGTTLAGTYNPVSNNYRPAPASWLLLSDIPSYESQTRVAATGPEDKYQARLLSLAARYVVAHPLYPAKVAFYNTRRFFDLAGMTRSRFTATTVGITSRHVAKANVVCAWVVSLVAIAGVLRREVRRALPGFVWLASALLFASVVLVNVETPRFRIVLDPFLILLAAGAIAAPLRRRARAAPVPQPAHPSGASQRTTIASN